MRGAVALETVGDEAAWQTAAPVEPLAKAPRRRVAITAGLEQDVDDVAVLVDGAPQGRPLAANRDEQLVEMPGVAEGAGPTPEPPRVGEAEGLAPLPDEIHTRRRYHVARGGRES
jgi:hypothetical protein